MEKRPFPVPLVIVYLPSLYPALKFPTLIQAEQNVCKNEKKLKCKKLQTDSLTASYLLLLELNELYSNIELLANVWAHAELHIHKCRWYGYYC